LVNVKSADTKVPAPNQL